MRPWTVILNTKAMQSVPAIFVLSDLTTVIGTVSAAVIGLIGAIIAVLRYRDERREKKSAGSAQPVASMSQPSLPQPPIDGIRRVYWQGKLHRFCNFGAKNCRIETLDGTAPSFLAPTHQLFMDAESKVRVTRDLIVRS
jgi:hypothetical protein